MEAQTTLVTAAQIASINTTPVAIGLRSGVQIPVQGRLRIHRALFQYNHNTTRFVNNNTGATLALQYSSTAPAGGAFVQQCSQAILAGSNADPYIGLLFSNTNAKEQVEDISCTMPTGVGTVYLAYSSANSIGSGDSTLSITLFYDILPN